MNGLADPLILGDAEDFDHATIDEEIASFEIFEVDESGGEVEDGLEAFFTLAVGGFCEMLFDGNSGQVSVKGRSTMPSTVSVQPFTSTFGTIRLMSTR